MRLQKTKIPARGLKQYIPFSLSKRTI